MNCHTCKESLLPENPTVDMWNPRKHEYDRPICESCPSFKEVSNILTIDVGERYFEGKSLKIKPTKRSIDAPKHSREDITDRLYR